MNMNKALYLLIIGLLCFSAINAQEFSFGIKGGPSYVSGGQITGRVGGGTDFGGTVEADSKFKYHGGGFFEVRFDKFLIRPELIYSAMETEFDFPTQPSTYALEKISVPLLLGYNVWGPVDIYAGPAYQKILDATLEGNEPDQPVIVQNSPLAGQAGIKAAFGRFELDLRYDRTFASKEPYIINIVNGGADGYGINTADFDDSRLNQILLSISFKIFDSSANPGRRKGSCYF
ncbi:Outer membrane protein beta-barrel domain-containing protein [Christiangramia echinicola]|uniref:Outer membrane protein beta-barrel domain-containing protein n=2 Tax=Christiangramia echinicola TaxID=279359 RepID=A0A1H1PK61_9FLAO|nr:Outer membrane protein beta-barrel domain-containing protein [Christiangramia echinicola]